MNRSLVSCVTAVLFSLASAACEKGGPGSDKTGSGGGTAEAGTDGGSGGSSGIDLFNGDCTTAKWAGVSDACWACACTTCKAQLDACDETCASLIQCALTQQCLVGASTDLACEVRCVNQVCVHGDPGRAAANSGPGTAFDLCLIGTTKPAGQFRACETECQINYTGKVCSEYPAAPLDAGSRP
jgi:hypothetical protein